MLLSLVLATGCMRELPNDRPGEGPDGAGEVLPVEGLEPAFGSTLGGGEALVFGGPFDGSARVFLGEQELEVLSVEPDALTVVLPETEEGRHDLSVVSDLGEGSLDDAYRSFRDATGLAGSLGAIEWYELQGDYWTEDSRDFGVAWWGLIEPEDLHYWDIFGVETDACASEPAFPELRLWDLGMSEAELQVKDRIFDGGLQDADYVEGARYSVPLVTGDTLPEFSVDKLAKTPSGFDLYSPYLYGSAAPALQKSELDIEWGAADADRVMILVERYDADLDELIEVVGCVASDDGQFKIPGRTWEQPWESGQWLYIYVGAVREDGGTLPLNNADSRVAGVYWLLGAAVTE
jgi:hypothetical protein